MALTIYNAKPYNSVSIATAAMGSNDGTLIVSGQEDVTDDLTVDSNIATEFPQGGTLNISAGKTVTFNGHIDAGLYQIFEGAGTVVIGNVATKIVPQWWGASPSASAATNSTAINASIIALPDYGQWELPGGEYDISTLITISTKENCDINFIGRLMCQACSGISFDDIDRCDIREVNVYLDTAPTWGSALYGIKLKNFNNSKITIRGSYNFGGKSLYLDGDTNGIAYNEIHLGWLYNSKYELYVRSVNGGFVNENNYYGGNLRLHADTKAAEADGWAIYFEASPSHTFNNHRFYGTCIETHHNGIQFNSCANITLVTPRFEAVDANWVNGGESIGHLVWILGTPNFDESKVVFNNNSRGLLILGAGTNDSNYRPIITDQVYGGISFASRHSFDDTVAHLYSRSLAATGLTYKDIFGVTQYFNKSHAAAAAPGAGGSGDSYYTNAVVWKPPVSGQSMGWTCSVAGTAGTLAGVTGGITNGEKVLTVNDASDLLEGMFITIVGVTGIKNIEKIDGEDVYIYVAADATVAGAAVAYSNPTWVTMPNYP